MAALDVDNNEDEIYSLFETKSTFNLQDNESYRKLLQSSQGNRPGSSRNIPLRIGTSTGFGQTLSMRPGSSFRPVTSFRPDSTYRADSTYRSVTGRPGTSTTDANRPMTAVRGAGYTSHGRKMFDPLNQAAQVTQQAEQAKEDTPEEKIHELENKIMQCIESSIVSGCSGRTREALDKAKEASSMERGLIRLQEQAGLSDSHNLDLTFAVLFNLAVQYTRNEMYGEALNTYQLITRNRMFANAHRLKVNMGNIYYAQGHVHKAVKLWRMALDAAPASHARLRLRIMHNIGVAHVRTGRYAEAAGVLEYVLGEGRGCGHNLHRAALHLVLCHYALEDVPRMRHAFTQMLALPLVELDGTAVDELSAYETGMRRDAERCILMAAKLVDDYEWCVREVRSSPQLAHLASDLEIGKAVMYLKRAQTNEAIEALRQFERSGGDMAATNLSFVYLLRGDTESAERHAQIVRSRDAYDAAGHVNAAVCAMTRGELSGARKLLEQALECDPSHAEALYDLGLCLAREARPTDALNAFRRLGGGLALLPEVLWQQAGCLAAVGDSEAAAECLQQLLGLVPTDPAVLSALAALHDRDGDRQQAHHYYHEAHRHYPSDVAVCNWLGGHHVDLQTGERALRYFERAARVQPGQVRWRLLAAACRRRAGDPHSALAALERALPAHQDSAELLRTLSQLCAELGRDEDAAKHAHELRRLERSRDVRDRLTSAQQRAGGSARRSATSSLGSAASVRHDSVEDVQVDASYVDPLGPLAQRPRTSALRTAGGAGTFDEDFGDEQIGDDLLPE